MKLRLRDRLLIAFLGLLLLALAGAAIAEGLCGAAVTAGLGALLAAGGIVATVVKAAVIVVCVALAALCAHASLRRTKRRDLVFQKTEGGELSISIKSIDHLVRKCVKTHDEIVLR